MLIDKRKNPGLKHLNDSNTFIEYSNDMEDIYENIEEKKANKNRKILTIFDGIIADNKKLNSKKLSPILIELFIRCRKLIISLSCFCYTILFCCIEKGKNNFYKLIYCGNSNQATTSTSSVSSSIRI